MKGKKPGPGVDALRPRSARGGPAPIRFCIVSPRCSFLKTSQTNGGRLFVQNMKPWAGTQIPRATVFCGDEPRPLPRHFARGNIGLAGRGTLEEKAVVVRISNPLPSAALAAAGPTSEWSGSKVSARPVLG